jgi:signal peptidase II
MNKLFLKNIRFNIATVLLVAIFFIADRYLKILAFQNFSEKSQSLIGDWLSFTFTSNYYIAFSIPLSGLFLNILLIIITTYLIIWLFKIIRRAESSWLIFGLLFIIFGALSNFIDRLAYGYVIDYFYLKYFAVFNLADVAISFGAILALIGLNKKPS